MERETIQLIKVRKAEADDVERIAVLSAQLGYPVTAEQMEDRLRQLEREPGHAIFVAETPQARVIGWVHVFIRQLLVTGRDAEVGGLIVDERFRQSGVGAMLLKQAERWASQRHCTAMRVRSNVVRDDAPNFYARAGYTTIKTQRVFHKILSPNDVA